MSEVELTHRQRLLLIRFVGVMIVAVVVLFLMTLLSGYETRKELTNQARAACETVQLDRESNAAAWTAHKAYIEKITSAKSVKADVKRAARKAEHTYDIVVTDLQRRTRQRCRQAFPNPPKVKFASISE